MYRRSFKQTVAVGVLGGLVAVVSASAARADAVVAPGFDLFVTDPGTTVFMGASWEGAPLGTFDFGGTNGIHDTGTTDTIVERLGEARVPSPPGTDTVNIEIVALQLVSMAPIDFGAGLDYHYITLQTATPSLGTMDITFDDLLGGTFDSSFDIFFDVRIGALNGQIIYSDFLSMTSYGNPWGREPPPGAVEIDGINVLLNGVDRVEDFWPTGTIEHDASGAGHHTVDATPEPASLSLLALGGLLVLRRRPR